jgi:sec-independent protein translocase protein TatA
MLGLQRLHMRCYARFMPVGIFQNFGVWEILLLLLVLLLVFGPKRLPEMGRSMGRGMREFKDSLTGKLKDEDEEEPAALATTTPVETPAPAPKAEQPTSSSS